jgi:hypothetical protein
MIGKTSETCQRGTNASMLRIQQIAQQQEQETADESAVKRNYGKKMCFSRAFQAKCL